MERVHHVLAAVILSVSVAMCSGLAHQKCGSVELKGHVGTLKSPGYPDRYPEKISCAWFIHLPERSVLTIQVEDLDIRGKEDNADVCEYNWLSLPQESNGESTGYRHFCGLNKTIPSVRLTKSHVALIKFHSSQGAGAGRGFILNYALEPDCIPYADGSGCFFPDQHSIGGRNCRESMDERNCPCVLSQNKFQCDNGRCVFNSVWCNGVDDCGDNSDEQRCIKNSIITAAIMGSLICGLLLVIAVGCMCRLYSLRLGSATTYRMYRDEASIDAGRSRTSIPPPDEFFHREPPPAYTVAVNEAQQLQRIVPQGPVASHARHGRRSQRRHTSGRRRPRSNPPSVAVMDPGTSVKVEDDACVLEVSAEGNDSATSTSSCPSPSRDSFTSSASLLSCVSTSDDVPLLVP